MRTRLFLLVGLVATSFVGYVACGGEDDAAPPLDGVDAGLDVVQTDATGGQDGAPTDASEPDSSSPDATPDSSSPDATPDAAPSTGVTCKAILDQNPTAATGPYVIDVDGDGPLPAVTAHCDMTFDGGGWTLIMSLPESSPGPGALLSPPADAGAVDGGPDAAWYVREPEPGALGSFSTWMAQALAELSTQVHIRTPFSVDAGVDGGAYVTSVVLPDGGPTLPIVNLRQGLILNANNDGGIQDWTGTFANGARMSHTHSGCNLTTTPYPSLYWGCNNFAGLHILFSGSNYQAWDYQSPQFGSPSDPFEVYVR